MSDKICGNDDCSCSTGIHGGLTFGSGELDEAGFWAKPCRPCAEAHDKKMDDGRRDDLTQEYITQHCESGMTLLQAQQRVRRDHEWLDEPAWPYKDSPASLVTGG
jgi:hypothetical protein